MPGPLPKSPAKRQRRNRKATRAQLPAEKNPISRMPSLPEKNNGEAWHKLTVAWWRDLWHSPMRAELMRSDLAALLRLAFLYDRFWYKGTLSVATEIRLLEREFGLTPMSRRRLDWTVATAEQAQDRREISRAKRAKIVDPASDPRGALE